VKIDKNSKVGLFLSHVIPGIIRPVHTLWNEVIGFVFMVLAVVFIAGAIRAYRAMTPQEITLGKIVLLCLLPALMLYFGITSFLKARKISRS
jgi:hypothetical protein